MKHVHTHTLHTHRGFSLIEVLVGSAIVVLIFVGVMGLLRVNLELVGHTRAQASALSLGNEQMEYIRSLPYNSVGTNGGIPSGNIPQETTEILNDVTYTVRTFIRYTDAPEDGIGVADANGLTNDYKTAKVEISWNLRGVEKSIALISNIVPPGIETTVGGGTLITTVFDALVAPVSGAEVRVTNASASPPIDVTTFSDTDGIAMFPGAPAESGYTITVTKPGYSSAQTYAASSTNPNPNPPNIAVVESLTSSISFGIDLVSNETITTLAAQQSGSFADTFADTSQIATSSNVVVGGGVTLFNGGGGYETSGSLQGITVTPAALSRWGELSWNDSTPINTDIRYHVYYINGSDPVLLPDSVLFGNAAGFSDSPVDISDVSPETYPELRVAATLTTTATSTTPTLSDWTLSYVEDGSVILNVPFDIHGDKTIGTDGGGLPIYKYDESLSTGGTGSITLSDLEWDNYTITIDSGGTGYDIADACPRLPRSILPGTASTTKIALVPHTTNTLHVHVENASGSLVPGADVRLTRSGFDTTLQSSLCGQTFFSGLGVGTVAGGNAYTATVSKSGYATSTVTDVEVSGASAITVSIN